MNVQTQLTPSEFLKTTIYPDLDQALIELIEHVAKTNVIIRHQEHLIEQKTLDKIEQKRIEKEKLKKELGSAYESSEESDDDFKRNEEEVNENPMKVEEGLISSGEFVDNAAKKEETNEEKEGGMTVSKENNFAAKKNKFGMVVIEEGDEGDEDNPKKVQLDAKTLFERELAKVKGEFNPVKFLGEILKKLAQAKKA